MKIKARVSLSVLVLLLTMFLAACGGSYGCQVTFGSSTCTPSGTGITTGGGGGGGGGGNGTLAFAYAVNQGGTIDGYTLTGSTFALTNGYLAPVIPTSSGGVGMVVAQNQFLYVGFGVTDQIYGYTIDSSGNLATASGSPFPAPYLSNYIGGVGEAEMITNPAGTTLFVSDTGQGEIYAYTIGSGGVLTGVGGSPFSLPSGFQPMNLTTDGLGKYLYAINGNFTSHTGTEIAAFSIGSGGVLAPVVGSPFAFPMWLVKGDPSGQFLIGTSGNTVFYSGVDDDNLYVFSITPSGANAGALTQIDKVPTVYSPYNIAVQSNVGGTSLYSFSFNDTATAFNPIEGYQINSTGALQVDVNSPFSGVANGSWGQFDQSGTLLFAYSSFLNASTNTQVTQIAPFDVGSTGALAQPVATLTVATQGFWVVTDPN